MLILLIKVRWKHSFNLATKTFKLIFELILLLPGTNSATEKVFTIINNFRQKTYNFENCINIKHDHVLLERIHSLD